MIAEKGCVLLSGGQDSTTCLAWAKTQFEKVYTFSVYYGQRHSKELGAASVCAQMAEVEDHMVFQLPLGSITKSDLLKGGGEIQEGGGLPTSFVPGRNLLMATLAASYCYPRGIDRLVLGVSQVDYSGYPDCRRSTIDALESAIGLGLDRPFTIHTPLVDLTKAESVVFARAQPLGWALLANSWTCYYGREVPCGECPACRLRAQGFAEAGETDPAL